MEIQHDSLNLIFKDPHGWEVALNAGASNLSVMVTASNKSLVAFLQPEDIDSMIGGLLNWKSHRRLTPQEQPVPTTQNIVKISYAEPGCEDGDVTEVRINRSEFDVTEEGGETIYTRKPKKTLAEEWARERMGKTNPWEALKQKHPLLAVEAFEKYNQLYGKGSETVYTFSAGYDFAQYEHEHADKHKCRKCGGGG